MIPALLILCLLLAAAVFILTVKICLMQKSIREICDGFEEKLKEDTNTLLTVSSADPRIRQLAASINHQLKILRKEQLQFQQGNQELKDAITNISHDLRTPLTAILGYMDLLKKEQVSESVSRYLSIIDDRMHALRTLTEELFLSSLILSVRPHENLKHVSLNRCLEECIASFYGVFSQKQIHPVIKMPSKNVERILDPGALSRIFENILGNALKYSEKDLIIWLDEEGRILFSNPAPNLDEITASQLFHRFFSVENGRNSTGLGLAIAKTLTEELGGTISASFAEQKLTICVSFPV